MTSRVGADAPPSFVDEMMVGGGCRSRAPVCGGRASDNRNHGGAADPVRPAQPRSESFQKANGDPSTADPARSRSPEPQDRAIDDLKWQVSGWSS
jgi:hypothetical protein